MAFAVRYYPFLSGGQSATLVKYLYTSHCNGLNISILHSALAVARYFISVSVTLGGGNLVTGYFTIIIHEEGGGPGQYLFCMVFQKVNVETTT